MPKCHHPTSGINCRHNQHLGKNLSRQCLNNIHVRLKYPSQAPAKPDKRTIFSLPKIGQKSARNLSTRKGQANLSRRTNLGRKTSDLFVSSCRPSSPEVLRAWILFARWHFSPRSDSLSYTAMPFRSQRSKISRKSFPQKANRSQDSVNGSTSRISTTALLLWRLKRKNWHQTKKKMFLMLHDNVEWNSWSQPAKSPPKTYAAVAPLMWNRKRGYRLEVGRPVAHSKRSFSVRQ